MGQAGQCKRRHAFEGTRGDRTGACVGAAVLLQLQGVGRLMAAVSLKQLQSTAGLPPKSAHQRQVGHLVGQRLAALALNGDFDLLDDAGRRPEDVLPGE